MTGDICGSPTKSTDQPCRNPAGSCPVPSHDDPPEYEPPHNVPCPCGGGEATLRPRQVTEPFTWNKSKQATHCLYRHDGCPIGGTLVLVDGEPYRRVGPLFEPERYSAREWAPGAD